MYFIKKITCQILALSLVFGGLITLTACNGGGGSGARINHTAPPNIANRGGRYKVGSPYRINGVLYTPHVDYNHNETGIASWYGPGFHGRHTANGETYDMNLMTAAHRTLPMPSMVRVTNLENGRSVVVRVNDRGPFANNRIIDMSRRGAEELGFIQQGTAHVRVEILAAESAALANGQNVNVAGGSSLARGGSGSSVVGSVLNNVLPQVASSVASQLVGGVGGALISGIPGGGIVSSAAGQLAGATAGTAVSIVAGTATSAANIAPMAYNAASNAASTAVSVPVSAPAPVAATPVYQPQVQALPQAQYQPQVQYQTQIQPMQPAYSPANIAVQPVQPVQPVSQPIQQVATVPLQPSQPVQMASVPQTPIASPLVEQYFVQVGSYSNRANAESMARSLTHIAPAHVTEVQVNGQNFYRVRFGPVEGVAEATKILEDATALGHGSSRIVVE